MLELTDLLDCLLLAVTAYVFVIYLTAEGAIFERYGDWLDDLVSRGKQRWANPIGACEKCLSGQLAAFYGLTCRIDFSAFELNSLAPIVFSQVAFISTTILLTILLKHVLKNVRK